MLQPRFRLTKELGSGTTGHVWHGVLTEGFPPYPAGFAVAVKYLHARLEREPDALAAFENEARAGRAALHPDLVHVIATGRDERGRFLVMPYVPGRTLRDVAKEAGALPEPLVRSIARQVSAGLAALHKGGFLHGDIKPENVRLDAEGNAVLLDLGFARPADEPDDPRGAYGELDHATLSHSRAGAVEHAGTGPRDPRRVAPRPGTLPYLAPEQARGESGSRASDVFALAVVLYELATGVHPFAAQALGPSDLVPGALPRSRHALGGGSASGSSGAIARAALEKPDADRLLAAIAHPRVRPPSHIDPRLSPFLDHLLGACLQHDAARRPSAAELEQRLHEQEHGAWWRGVVESEPEARGGSVGEPAALHLTQLVGRDRELDVMLEAFANASGAARSAAVSEAAGESRREASGELPRESSAGADSAGAGGGAVWLSGDSGAGKSRLVNELAARVRMSETPPLYLYGRCRELQEERPAQPIVRMLERWLRLSPRAAARERERAQLETLVPPRVVQTLVAALDPQGRETPEMAIGDALAEWLTTLGKREPLLVYLDDVQWAGESTLGVLAKIAEQLSGTRILLVLGLRLGVEESAPATLARVRERLAAQVTTREVRLEPLDESAVLELVRLLFHHSVPQLRLAHVLWERSRGNPGLVFEILRGLIDRGQAQALAAGERLVLRIAPDELPLPGSLRKAIGESYRRLPTADRQWLRRLAVVGGHLETDFLARAFPDARRAEIDEMLARLVRTGWLVSMGARYRFARPALREAVYRSLSRDQRARLHAAAARALRSNASEEPSIDDAFQIAFHERAAGHHEALLGELPELMARLLRSGQPQRVHALARWGLEAIDALPKDEARGKLEILLLERAVDAADRLGFRTDQRSLLDRLAELEFDPDLDPESVGRVYLLHGRYAVSTGQYGLARGCLKNAVEMFERSGKLLELAESLRRLSLVQGHVGELAEARELAERSFDLAQTDLQRALAKVSLGIADVLEDRFERALENAEAALALLRREKHRALPGAYAAVYMLSARVHRILGNHGRALGAAMRAAHLARRAGERRLEAEATARLGGMLLDADRPEEAEARLREALLVAEEIEDRRGQALARLFLGILLWEAAQTEAQPMLERANELASSMGLNRVEAVCCAIRARIHREAGELDTALSLTTRANELVKSFGAELNDRIVIAGTHALVLRTMGREDEADEIEEGLRGRVERENGRLETPLRRLRHGRASERLLEAVLSPEGPVYPRSGERVTREV